jgi:hypothetical protein
MLIILTKRPKYALERDEKTIYGLGLAIFPFNLPAANQKLGA